MVLYTGLHVTGPGEIGSQQGQRLRGNSQSARQRGQCRSYEEEFPQFAIKWQAVFRAPGTTDNEKNKRVMGLHPDAPLSGRTLKELRNPGLE